MAPTAPPSQSATRRRRGAGAALAPAGEANCEESSALIVAASEDDADAQVQSHLADVLAVGDVEAQRSDGAAVVHADAIAEHRAQIVPAVGGIAGVDEHGAEQ